jgi:hypothetical protein
MARAERYIAPSEEELQRWQRAEERARQFDRERVELLRTALKRVRKADLVELTLRLAEEEQANQCLLERELALDKPVDLLPSHGVFFHL